MAEEYLNKISTESKDEHGRNNEADFRDRWRKQLSVVVQCNFNDFTYDRDIQHFVHRLLLFCIKLALVIGRVSVQIKQSVCLSFSYIFINECYYNQIYLKCSRDPIGSIHLTN